MFLLILLKNIEERFRKKSPAVGDINIVSNKGRRGTDIHVDEQGNQKGGMHVIWTDLPENVQVAFGRTARNGASGTGEYIFRVEKSAYENTCQRLILI